MKKIDNKQQLKELFKLCLPIALIIFVIAYLSDFAVRLFYSSTDIFMQFLSVIVAIFIITAILMFMLWNSPKLRKAVARSFGMED